MLSKTKSARRAAKPAARKKTVKKITLTPELTRQDVADLEIDAARQARSERTWLSMTSPPHEEDHWGGIEEHLLAKGSQEQDSERRWKYFAK